LFLHLFTCVYIACATSSTLSWLNMFHQVQPVLLLWICQKENIRDSKKDKVFLLVWDKDGHTERFLALLPWTCVLQPTLVHLYQTSLILPGPLPIVSSANLRLFCLLLNKEHINHIQVLGFLSFHYVSHVCSPLSVWPMSNNITTFVLSL
jgi:hypothetical protein